MFVQIIWHGVYAATYFFMIPILFVAPGVVPEICVDLRSRARSISAILGTSIDEEILKAAWV